MAKVFLIDVAKCSGCYNCQLACKDEHCGNDWSPYSKPQPQIGQFWCKVSDHVCGTIPKVKIHYISQLCGHCRNAACMEVCPEGAIYRRDDGFIIIDPEKCSGCKKCMEACPYDAIFFNKELNIAQKCTGCAHLLDNGYKLPRCVEACPTDAMRFGEEEDMAEDLKGAVTLKPESGCQPRVYYKNIPGRFIAATVYDPVEKEVIIGSKCTLTSNGRTWETETDSYGDFWFKDLPQGNFDLVISAKGFKDKEFKALNTEKDINLGDIPLER